MENSKLVKIGILGLGVVGSELVSIIRKNASRIEKETGIKLVIEKVFVRSMDKTRTIDTTGLSLTTNVTDIINDPDITHICECIGGNGCEQTFEIIKSCMQQKKHVIMSSKKTLAKYAEVLLFEAYNNNVSVKYDATVGGGIPIAKVLENSLKGDYLKSIYGIFNATSNFIYSKMLQESQPFDDALRIAQNKGYAENDPSDDVDGYDSLYKLIILSLFGSGKILKPDWINPVTFRDMDIKDMNYAKELGYVIKPVAAINFKNDDVSYYVSPFLVKENNIIAKTTDNYNAIVLEGETCGPLGFYGQGAGAAPTASAMFDDLIGISINSQKGNKTIYKTIKKDNIKHIDIQYYLRFSVKNETGVLAVISNYLASKNINIERVIQKNETNSSIDLVFITSKLCSDLKVEITNHFKKANIRLNSGFPVLW